MVIVPLTTSFVYVWREIVVESTHWWEKLKKEMGMDTKKLK